MRFSVPSGEERGGRLAPADIITSHHMEKTDAGLVASKSEK